MSGDRDSDDDVFTSAAKNPARSVAPPERVAGAISSGPFEIDRASLAPAPSGSLPPLSTAEDFARPPTQQAPLSRIVGIGAAIFVFVIALTLLLFR